MIYQLDINDRAFSAIQNKTKTIEIRANKIDSELDYSQITQGDIIKFSNSKDEVLTCKVIKNQWYSSIEELLMLEGTKMTLSSTNDYQKGINSINQLNGYETAIKTNGVYAIHIKYMYSDDSVWEELYQIACDTLNPSSKLHIDYGGVAAVVLSENENIYTGVCIDTDCSIGMCAERNAIANMLTNKETKIKKLVCIGTDKNLMFPCGVCREFMMQLDTSNKDMDILVNRNPNLTTKLEALIPYWENK